MCLSRIPDRQFIGAIMPVPPISIVIPSHHRADLLRHCLASVQTHSPFGTQVIVVDDGSRDEVIGQTASEFTGVEVIRHPRPLGFCRAANAGIAASRAPIIEMLNDDTKVTADWADAALKRFRDPAVGAVAPLVLQGPRGDAVPVIDSAGDEYDLGGFARKRGHGLPLCHTYLESCDVFGASASSAFYRADVLRVVGRFPVEFGAYFEDVDLAWRIGRAGYRTIYEPASRVWHLVGSSYRKRRVLIERQSQNEERVFWRNVPNLWKALPRHAAVLAGKAICRCREGTLTPFLTGRFRVLAEIESIARHRRELFKPT